jgi:hypothetical protein
MPAGRMLGQEEGMYKVFFWLWAGRGEVALDPVETISLHFM